MKSCLLQFGLSRKQNVNDAVLEDIRNELHIIVPYRIPANDTQRMSEIWFEYKL